MSLSPTHRPTDTDDTPPTHYLSIRLTCPHDEWARIEQTILEGIDHYVAYPHIGKSEGGNPHWHIFIPAGAAREGDRIRNRIKREYGTGNAVFSIKYMSNGLLHGLQYGGREKTQPMVGRSMQRWVDQAPAWVEGGRPVVKTPKEKLGSPVLTLSNVLKQALKFARARSLDCNLTEILYLMVQDGWVPSRDILTKGIPRPIHDEYLMCLGRKARAPHQWMFLTDPTEEQLRWRERPDTTPGIFHDPGIIQTGTLTI